MSGMAFELGGAEGIRTPDPLDANEVRYRTALQPQIAIDGTSRARTARNRSRQPSRRWRLAVDGFALVEREVLVVHARSG
jgi:hypothetical protein